MIKRNAFIGALAVAAILFSVARLAGQAREPHGIGRRPVTQRVLACDPCGARVAVTQQDLMQRYRPEPAHAAGGPVLMPCSRCGATSARLVVEARP